MKKIIQVRFLRHGEEGRKLYNRGELAGFPEEVAHKLTRPIPFRKHPEGKADLDGPVAEWVGEVVNGQVVPGPPPETIATAK